MGGSRKGRQEEASCGKEEAGDWRVHSLIGLVRCCREVPHRQADGVRAPGLGCGLEQPCTVGRMGERD